MSTRCARSEETKRKISITMKSRGYTGNRGKHYNIGNTTFLGRHHSEETKLFLAQRES